jgi:hypothetical protein
MTTATVLDPQLDSLLLQARGLALVRDLLARRGASCAELEAHDRELARVRETLVELLS